MAQLDAKHGSLQAIQPPIEPDHLMVVFHRLPVIAQHAQPARQRGIIRGDGATIAHRSQILAGIEAERGGMAEAPGAAPLVCGAMRLAGVF